MKPPSGLSQIQTQKPKLLRLNKNNWRIFSIQSWQDCIKKILELQAECLAECQVECQEDSLGEPQQVIKAGKKGLKLMKSIDLIVHL